MKKIILIAITAAILIFLVYPVISWQVFKTPTFMSKEVVIPIDCMPGTPRKWKEEQAIKKYYPFIIVQKLFGSIKTLCGTF
ncbi:MAG: hypothetical protein NTZ18_04660 [Candidatus Komeilibacteria bacterium]|nr:hypothetical protein [Candidatus Komeilibacteria bacterium]